MSYQTADIYVTEARKTVQVHLSTGDVLEGAINTSVEDFLKTAIDKELINGQYPLVACICNGRLRELTYPLNEDSHVAPIFLSHSDGGRVYRRSLIMLLTAVVDELFPEQRVSVAYAVPDGGFYCELIGNSSFTPEQLQKIETRMREMVKEDIPITKRIVPLNEAIELFNTRGEHEKVRLMAVRASETLTLYKLRQREDYHYGYMVPSTGYLKIFRLIPLKNGFIMQYPRSTQPNVLSDVSTNHKLIDVFHESDSWLEKMNVSDIGRLNLLVEADNIQELILIAEALHEQRVATIAQNIQHELLSRGARVVLIAGPSCSGKTTFSKRLAIQLLAYGLRPFTLEMDNYFVDRHLTPRDESGEYDFESLNALNLELFNDHLNQLLAGDEIQLPVFDFHTGQSKPGKTAKLGDNQIIIIEGIHGLNPNLVPNIDPNLLFRVYVSALTALNIDSHNRIPTTDVRLLRRIVRDARSRGYNAVATLQRWSSVRRGEKRNIFPYQENADAIFNSALVYELASLRSLADQLLLQVPYGTKEHIEANRLLSFLRWVRPLTPGQQSLIPDTSLLREFIGGSILDHYHPGVTLKVE